jgi:hypothetical protein
LRERIARVIDWWRGEPRIALHDLTADGPKYRVTQPGNPFKAKRTWEKSMRVYINQRKVG